MPSVWHAPDHSAPNRPNSLLPASLPYPPPTHPPPQSSLLCLPVFISCTSVTLRIPTLLFSRSLLRTGDGILFPSPASSWLCGLESLPRSRLTRVTCTLPDFWYNGGPTVVVPVGMMLAIVVVSVGMMVTP